jgi:hypothetical protein
LDLIRRILVAGGTIHHVCAWVFLVGGMVIKTCVYVSY